LLPEDPRLNHLFKIVYLERGLLIGAAAMLIGLAMLLVPIILWERTGFGRLDYAHTMRIVVPGITLTALGYQTILSSFFVSILGMRRK
jgi:hypothetical protein